MYSRFVFGNFNDFNDYDLNKRQRHPYGAFLDFFDGIGDQNLFWHCKKRMFQNKIRATSENAATDKVKEIRLTRSTTHPIKSITADELIRRWILVYVSFR